VDPEHSGHPPESVLKPALRLLSARARSVRELRDRLHKKSLNPRDISFCLQWLEERGFLNDEDFAGALVRDRLRFSPRSPFLLKRELREKGVEAELAERVVERVCTEEGFSTNDLAQIAAEDWVRKQGPTIQGNLILDRFSPDRERARRRLYGFLARRGFAGDAARWGIEAGEHKARTLAEDKEARNTGE
jgi:regulatory protein